jgi:hypothetical protein
MHAEQVIGTLRHWLKGKMQLFWPGHIPPRRTRAAAPPCRLRPGATSGMESGCATVFCASCAAGGQGLLSAAAMIRVSFPEDLLSDEAWKHG